METSNEIVIRAPVERVFAYAADTERWPVILPHYRWVRRIKGTDDHKIVEMAAWRDIYPVRWTAVQRNLPGSDYFQDGRTDASVDVILAGDYEALAAPELVDQTPGRLSCPRESRRITDEAQLPVSPTQTAKR